MHVQPPATTERPVLQTGKRRGSRILWEGTGMINSLSVYDSYQLIEMEKNGQIFFKRYRNFVGSPVLK